MASRFRGQRRSRKRTETDKLLKRSLLKDCGYHPDSSETDVDDDDEGDGDGSIDDPFAKKTRIGDAGNIIRPGMSASESRRYALRRSQWTAKTKRSRERDGIDNESESTTIYHDGSHFDTPSKRKKRDGKRRFVSSMDVIL